MTKPCYNFSISFFGLICTAYEANVNAFINSIVMYSDVTGIFLSHVPCTKCLKTLVLCESHNVFTTVSQQCNKSSSHIGYFIFFLLPISKPCSSAALFQVCGMSLKQVRANMPPSENACSNIDLTANWILPIKPHSRHQNHPLMSRTVVSRLLSQQREEFSRLQWRLCMAVRGVYISDSFPTNQAPCGTVAHR